MGGLGALGLIIIMAVVLLFRRGAPSQGGTVAGAGLAGVRKGTAEQQASTPYRSAVR